MSKMVSVIQKFAWVYAAMFLITVLVSHIASFTDSQGLLFGLYHVSPLIDSVHFLSGVLAVVVAWHSTEWSVVYFKFAGVIFGVDVLLSLFFSRDLLETFSIVTKGIGPANFTVTNLLANSPHTLIALFALWAGFRFSKRFAYQAS